MKLGRFIDTKLAKILEQKGLDRNPELWREKLDRIGAEEVERALAEPPGAYSLRKLSALVSPAAENYIEEMAQAARQLTVQRFGRTMRLYGPLYVSNYCSNSCRYCGFNRLNKSRRTRLTIEQALEDADIIAEKGFRDILLVSGEDRQFVTIDYLAELARRLRSRFASISMEVYQMSRAEYARLFEAGIEGVTIYQETYDRRAYDYYHPAGPKSNYDDRLTAPDSIAGAGMREVGLGALLGLTDWRVETLALAEHAHHLVKRYWKSHVSFSFPRLRPIQSTLASDGSPCAETPNARYRMQDMNLVQMITALRLCFADAGLVLSTREPARLRDNLIKLGITKISAGSKTNPGGYSGRNDAIEQFEVDDSRPPEQVVGMIESQGFEPVWKDWDRAFLDAESN